MICSFFQLLFTDVSGQNGLNGVTAARLVDQEAQSKGCEKSFLERVKIKYSTFTKDPM